jgi:tetratricopeptide (TPR) repeat protein
VHADLRQLPQAITQFARAAAIYRELDDRYETARALHMLGDTLHAAAQPTQAQDAWQEALTIYEALHVPQAAEVRAHLS